MVSPDEVMAEAQRVVAQGVRVLKVKVGRASDSARDIGHTLIGDDSILRAGKPRRRIARVNLERLEYRRAVMGIWGVVPDFRGVHAAAPSINRSP